jgi:hypothetical protein
MANVVTARYNMVFHLYLGKAEQNEDTGQVIRWWEIAKDKKGNPREISCIARGVTGGGIRVVGSTERWGGGEYSDVEWVKLWTREMVTKRDRIGNIRSKGRKVSDWRQGQGELDFIVFDVLGGTPIQDPFGRLVEYDVLLTRSEEIDSRWIMEAEAGLITGQEILEGETPTSDSEWDSGWNR